MNYRHAFHAGNFADVFKHAILSRIIVYLREKPQAFRVVDTHAGAGRYDLMAEEASRTGEWQKGVARLLATTVGGDFGELLAPYLEVLTRANPGTFRFYPGSPLLALALMRPQDRLIACELEPGAAAALAANLKPDRRGKAVAIDGWVALNAYVPPKERRGLVMVDPPFEEGDEFARLAGHLAQAWRKWPTGTYALWYPIKDRSGPDVLAQALRTCGIGTILRTEIDCAGEAEPGALSGCGLVIVNPPWRLAGELARMLPPLADLLSDDRPGKWRLDWLAGEK
jgi:23S rRNA (adenine2030-N6)-methyltransferase